MRRVEPGRSVTRPLYAADPDESEAGEKFCRAVDESSLADFSFLLRAGLI